MISFLSFFCLLSFPSTKIRSSWRTEVLPTSFTAIPCVVPSTQLGMQEVVNKYLWTEQTNCIISPLVQIRGQIVFGKERMFLH